MKRLILAVFLICAANLWAATYYVANTGSDSNPGTQAQPFQTIAHSAAVAQAGDTVIVENGTYPEIVSFNNSGTANAPITFMAQNQYGAVIAPTVDTQIVFNVNGGYITFKGFDFVGDSGGGDNDGIKFQWVSGNPGGSQALNNEFHHFGLVSGCSGGAPIVSAQPNTVIDSNLLYDNGACQLEDGIYLNDGNGQTVTNNIVISQGSGSPLQLNGEMSQDTNFPSNINMSNNTVVNAAGMIFMTCYKSGYVCTNDTFNNNLLVNINNTSQLSGTAFYEGPQPAGGTWGGGISFTDNLVYEGSPDGFCSYQYQPPRPCIGTVSGTITSNPLFISNIGDQPGNYQLQADSPAIGAGTNAGCPKHDFAGNPRNGGCTIGAYTYSISVSGAPNPPHNLAATVN
jgi:hypothetical protein